MLHNKETFPKVKLMIRKNVPSLIPMATPLLLKNKDYCSNELSIHFPLLNFLSNILLSI